MSVIPYLTEKDKDASDFGKLNWVDVFTYPKSFFSWEPFYQIDVRTKIIRFEQEESEPIAIETKPISINIKLDSDQVIELPIQLKDIATEIEASKYILSLEDNWDDEGSTGYKKATWIRAARFIANYSTWILQKTNSIMEPPRISHGPAGSIDIYWKNDNYRLLINVPENSSSPLSVYGDDYNSNKIKGTLDPSQFNFGLLLCLIAMK